MTFKLSVWGETLRICKEELWGKNKNFSSYQSGHIEQIISLLNGNEVNGYKIIKAED